MNITGIRDLDLEILKRLNDVELGKICLVNKYFHELCKNEDFWRNRTIEKFSKYLGDFDQLNKYKLQSKCTWRLYYISLINFIESFYSRKEFGYILRQDFPILSSIFGENHRELLDEISNNFNAEKWKEILKRELNSQMMYFTYGNLFTMIKYIKLLIISCQYKIAE